ncbi:MAG TPA: acyl-CoA dehydrogenase family protein [Acidisphaera sp.]|nr:acyl-CoA dehydrogenase family protein [Acidisphaera sp.]
MDFDYTDEQRLLKDSVDRLIADRYGFEQRKKYIADDAGFSRELWAQYAELGLLGLPFPEEYGGFGGGAVETAIVMEAFGRGLVIEPYLATVLLGGALVLAAGTPEQKQDILPRVADGRTLLAFAHHERHARYDLADVTTHAREHAGAWRIDGEKSLVLHGDAADTLIVPARIAGNRRDRGGVALFLVDKNATRLTPRFYRTQDNMRAAEIHLQGTPATPLGTATGSAFAIIERVVDRATAALCAEAIGAMEALHAMTVDYLKTRKQFGRPIGDFQVLQHRAVDMFTALEQARSMALFAAVMAEDDNAEERTRAIAAAKVQIGRSARHVGQEAIQLHGGIAMTMEYAAGHYFKRLTMIDKTFGDADWHIARLAAAGGLFAPKAA